MRGISFQDVQFQRHPISRSVLILGQESRQPYKLAKAVKFWVLSPRRYQQNTTNDEPSSKTDPSSFPSLSLSQVWPLLYASMGYASHLTVKALDRTPPGFGRRAAELSMTLYYSQLALNAIWTPLNFGVGQLALALVDIVALTGTVGYWCYSLRDVDTTASNLVLPYVGESFVKATLDTRKVSSCKKGFWLLD